MTYTLKPYQQQALGAVQMFLHQMRLHGNPADAFRDSQPPSSRRSDPYLPLHALPDVPFVCVCFPTGGGKTLVGLRCVLETLRLPELNRPGWALWVVPGDAVLSTTVQALRDQNLYPSGTAEVVVLSAPELTRAKTSQIRGRFVIVVTTKASVTQVHTVMAVERSAPVVVLDDAHNADTRFPFEILTPMAPRWILELAANPRRQHAPERGFQGSNVLIGVSADKLKTENMVKLPVELRTHPTWHVMVAAAAEQRAALERHAQDDQAGTSCLLPIAVYRNDDQSGVPADELVEELVQGCDVSREDIAVVTGSGTTGADGVTARHVVIDAAAALTWTCPDVYVLCLTSRQLAQKDDVLIGMVLRQSQAPVKRLPELKRAYLYVTTADLPASLQAVTDSLSRRGFPRHSGLHLDQRPLLTPPSAPTRPLFVTTPAGPGEPLLLQGPLDATRLPAALAAKVHYDRQLNRLSLNAATYTPEDLEALRTAVVHPADASAFEDLKVVYRHSPSERQIVFCVPRLMFREDDTSRSRLFDDRIPLPVGWTFKDCTAEFSETEFPAPANATEHGRVDVNAQGQFTVSQVAVPAGQQRLLGRSGPAGALDLARSLAQGYATNELRPYDTEEYAMKLIERLLRTRNIPLADLQRDSVRLAEAIRAKLTGEFKRALVDRRAALLRQETLFEVGSESPFVYPLQPPNTAPYLGHYHFQKHYYPHPGDLRPGGEEEAVACRIDGIPEVDFWVRNPARNPYLGFWLQTSTDRMYPDFVVRLRDGRVVAVEYKGEHLASTADTEEKRRIGALWAARSGGRVKFLLLEKSQVRDLPRLLLQESEAAAGSSRRHSSTLRGG